MTNRKYKDYHRLNENNIEEKQCIDCLEWFEMNDNNFSLDNKNKDKFSIRCKTCQKIYNHKTYMADRENRIAKSYQYILDHPEQTKVTYKRYMKTDSWKAYKKQNFIRSKSKMKEWRQNHPEKCRGYVEKKRQHDITEAEWRRCLEQFDHKCAYCGMTEKEHLEIYKQKLHREHADSGGANDLRNAVPSCQSCNYKKWIFPMEEWFREQDYFTEEKLWYIYWWTTEGYKDYIDDKPPYRIIRKIDKETRKFHHELWSVDIHRNMIECITIENMKKDIINKLENGIIPMPTILPLSKEDIM